MNTGMAAEVADRIAAELVEIDLQIEENKAMKQWFTKVLKKQTEALAANSKIYNKTGTQEICALFVIEDMKKDSPDLMDCAQHVMGKQYGSFFYDPNAKACLPCAADQEGNEPMKVPED